MSPSRNARPWSACSLLVVLLGATVPLAAQDPGLDGSTDTRTRVLLAAPAGDTLAILRGEPRGSVLDESGSWVRVRIEGWMPRAELPDFDPTSVQGEIRLADVRADPQGMVGATVRWRVQHIALQRADSLRAEMEMGEPYLLVRDPGGEVGFVYVTVPSALGGVAANLVPLQRVEIVGRVRAGRSRWTGHPVVELISLEPL